MARTASKVTPKNSKQRSAPKRSLPLSANSKPVKKPTTTKKKISKPKPQSARKQSKKILSLSLAGKARLEITLSRPKPQAAKRRPAAKKGSATKKTNKKREMLFTAGLLVIGLTGSIFFGMRVFASTPPAPIVPPPISIVPRALPQTVTELSLPASTPTRLRAAAIGLDAPLTTVGLRKDGSLEVPSQPDTAGWYRSSPTPGEIGPSIIVGHLDSLHGVAVFWRLRELGAGQTIEVERADGTVAKFVIESVKQVPQDAFPTAEIYGNTPNASLRLITCSGTFNRLTGHYSDNTIIFARLIP